MTLYPQAVQRPLAGHSAPGTLAQRKLIVLHITAGSTAAGAIATFVASKAPHRVSAHFVIDRDGTVFQLLPLEDTAWHASAVNSLSIGIEHAAIPNDPKHAITPEQYASSAQLVNWLCATLKIPCDRQHILGHFEASPNDRHFGCCSPTLSPDEVIALAKLEAAA